MKSFPTAPDRYRMAVRFGLFTLGLAALVPWRVAAQAAAPVPTPPVPTAPAPPTGTVAPSTLPVPVGAAPTTAAPPIAAVAPGASPAAATAVVPALPRLPSTPGMRAHAIAAPVPVLSDPLRSEEFPLPSYPSAAPGMLGQTASRAVSPRPTTDPPRRLKGYRRFSPKPSTENATGMFGGDVGGGRSDVFGGGFGGRGGSGFGDSGGDTGMSVPAGSSFGGGGGGFGGRSRAASGQRDGGSGESSFGGGDSEGSSSRAASGKSFGGGFGGGSSESGSASEGRSSRGNSGKSFGGGFGTSGGGDAAPDGVSANPRPSRHQRKGRKRSANDPLAGSALPRAGGEDSFVRPSVTK